MDLSPQEYQACPLHFYDFKHLDHMKLCPTYSLIFSSQHSIPLDDLDKLQAELSNLKEAAQNRVQLLTSELTVLNDWHVRRKRKHSDTESGSTAPFSSTAPSNTRGTSKSQSGASQKSPLEQLSSSSTSKRTKASHRGGGGGGGGGVDEHKKGKGKSRGSGETVIPEKDQNQITSALTKSKTEGADKFWASLEPYFADITENDLHNLQAQDNNFDKSLFEIPSQGQHYSQQWLMEELNEEGTETARLHSGLTKDLQDETNILFNEGMTANRSNTCTSYGPLTQKLMATFIDSPHGSQLFSSGKADSFSSTVISPAALERRLKEELVTLGLLDPPESQRDSSDDEDEVVKELVKAQTELKAVHEYNQQQKRMLHSLAKSEIRRQEIRKQLQETDQEVMEWLRVFSSYRQRKKKEPIKQKERESAQRCLDKRHRLSQHLLV
ncbi:PREDICTED: transcriptional adapter 3-like isoform X2 [Amphimedon queenslandica]|uniref:Transcriptional adapter 3 n=1 Tax=Amphimedon queenslandica TaxID=400682 RepID=A0A1X7U2P1_AMPQE|nr:PREDICTED: transcriptional adapter 3-like isoform X2 [Amphimedon queenslandica]|eukprot:XP_019856487.1 PREDICTED: transcriptional adapter 3-like isoform X2 [Amphimedon queenslandica]